MNKINANDVAEEIKRKHVLMFLEGKFYLYDKGVYAEISSAEVASLIKKVLGESYSIHARNEVLACLSADVFIRFDQLITPAFLINLKNGYLNIEKFELIPHVEVCHFTSQIDCDFVPDAECPKWREFLTETFEGDVSKIQILQEYFGYILNPLTNFEKALLLLGQGANGKSVILNVLRGMLGDRNCSSVPLEQFNNKNYLAEFFGKMVNVSTESNTRGQIYESSFKQLVSGETVTADRKYGHPFQFKNTCKLTFAFNDTPRINDKSDAVYRRLIPIYFNRQVPEGKQNKALAYELLLERSGILNWGIEGLKRLRAQNEFTKSESVNQALLDYKKENNNVMGFVEDYCTTGGQYRISKKSLYDAYKGFCKDNNYHPLSMNKFGKQLQRVAPGIVEYKTAKARCWDGISLSEFTSSNSTEGLPL